MSSWKLFKSAAFTFLTGTTLYWIKNGDVISVCANVSGSDCKVMAEVAERKTDTVVRKVGGVGLMGKRVFMSSNGHGLQAVSMVDVPWSRKTEGDLIRSGLVEVV